MLNHSNIIKCFGVFNSKRSFKNHFKRSTFLILEYMQHDFLSILKKHKFSLPEVKCLMIQLLEGMAYLHANNIIHRDLKSGNLLMNDRGCMKIADFGLARKCYGRTRMSHNVVTFWYRCPELLFGAEKYDHKVDIWSIGCIFAEFLTGKILFRGSKPKDQMQTIYEKLGNPLRRWPEVCQLKLYKELKPMKEYEPGLKSFIRHYNPKVDEDTLDLLQRMLEYNPRKRISAKEALEHKIFFKHPLPCRKEEIKRFRGEYHELNHKNRGKEPSEDFVLKDHRTVMSQDYLKLKFKKKSCERIPTWKDTQQTGGLYHPSSDHPVNLDEEEIEPSFSSDEEAVPVPETKLSTKQNGDFSPDKAFFSDDERKDQSNSMKNGAPNKSLRNNSKKADKGQNQKRNSQHRKRSNNSHRRPFRSKNIFDEMI